MARPGITTRTWLRNAFAEFVYETPEGVLRGDGKAIAVTPLSLWLALLDQRREHIAKDLSVSIGQKIVPTPDQGGPDAPAT